MALEQLRPIVEFPQETVDQFDPLGEEVLLQGGDGGGAEGPEQPLLAEERLVTEQAGEGRTLRHHVAVWAGVLSLLLRFLVEKLQRSLRGVRILVLLLC